MKVKNHILAIINHNNENKFIHVDASFINPFAIWHKINHPPLDNSPNVMALDLVIPNHFFPSDYIKFMHYLKFS